PFMISAPVIIEKQIKFGASVPISRAQRISALCNTAVREVTHGEESSQEESRVEEAQILAQLQQRRGERNAPLQEGHCKKRTQRKGRQGEEPKASHRYRPVQSSQEREKARKKCRPANLSRALQRNDGHLLQLNQFTVGDRRWTGIGLKAIGRK